VVVDQILEDHSTILWLLLKITVNSWLRVVACGNIHNSATEIDVHYPSSDNDMLHVLLWEHTEHHKNLTWLEEYYNIIHAGGTASMQCKPSTHAYKMMTELRLDFEDIIEKMQRQMQDIRQRISLLASLRSIKESQKAIKQADTIGYVYYDYVSITHTSIRVLTALATFFIPLSYVSSIYGMNVSEISAQTTSLGQYFATAIPLTVFCLFLIAKSEAIVKMWRKYCEPSIIGHYMQEHANCPHWERLSFRAQSVLVYKYLIASLKDRTARLFKQLRFGKREVHRSEA
jgi:hypothetical protein